MPIDSMIPPRAGAYSSLDTLQKFKQWKIVKQTSIISM